MWTRQGELYDLIQKKKKELGKIPEETCPDIDSLLVWLDLLPEDKRSEFNSKLEKLREDNATLRTLGREWYEFCEELSSENDKTIKDLESEYVELEKENENLKDEIERLKYDLKNV